MAATTFVGPTCGRAAAVPTPWPPPRCSRPQRRCARLSLARCAQRLRRGQGCGLSEIGVGEAARWLSISPQRVRALIGTGALPARQVSGVWLVDTTLPWRVHRLSRPLSSRTAAALLATLSGQAAGDLPRSQVARLKEYVTRLRSHPQPGRLLDSWVAARPGARPLPLTANPADLRGILEDPDLVPSGMSDPRSGLGSGGEVEGWVREAGLDEFSFRHMLSPSGRPNVFLRLSPFPVDRPVPLGLLVADLASWPGDREQAAVARLLQPDDA